MANEDPTSVAVIGLACRFPGDASSPANFWDLLCEARSAYSDIPKDRFNVKAFHSSDKDKINTSTPRGGHFLRQDVAAFDANFFSITQSEAVAMDPQQRFILEIAYEAFENAGLPLDSVAGTDTACFMGNFTTDYREMLFRDSDSAPLYAVTGSGSELTSNRVSWFYDLRGPSFTLNTACSSGLVALHQGCQSIRTGESSMALVGASNLLLNPEMFMLLSNQNFLAPGGRCRSFDASGDGYGRGEGFAAVLLKNVSDAIRDGDPIRAIIRGTGVNQDGKTKGLTVPSADAQANLIRSTYGLAGLDFIDTNYFEAHGTGTKAGDPLELEGIAKTICSVRKPGKDLIVGSVKSNIGHLESVAGLAGLIKGILILENGMIPANINFDKPNPRIPFKEWKIAPSRKLIPWPTEGIRRLSVQAFGYGGTNAHAVLDDAYHYLAERGLDGIHFTKSPSTMNLLQAPTSTKYINGINYKNNGLKSETPKTNQPRLFILSAQDKDGLKRQRESLAKYLVDRSNGTGNARPVSLRDLAFTLAEKRSRLTWRLCLSASSNETLITNLQNNSLDKLAARPSKKPRVGFIFTGQGAQWARMGMGLLQYRIFRESIEDADDYLFKTLGCTWSVLKEMCRDDASSNINLPAYSQPLCTILQVALVDLLESWNIQPSLIAGHSSGEIAGAYCVGALTREDAWKVAYFRGLLSSQMKSFSPPLKGAMLAVGVSEDEAENWICRYAGGEVVVACVNSPTSVTLSGSTLGINDMELMFKEAGVFARKLKVDVAYHSPHMEMISVAYLESMRNIETRPGRKDRKMYSAVTGASADAGELGPINWVRNLVSPVLFYDAVRELLQEQKDANAHVDILLEIGPHAALKGPINQIMKKHNIEGVNTYSVLSRGQNAVETALALASTLFTQGVPVDLCCANNDTDHTFRTLGRPLVDLPSYCWNHSRTYWAESRISKQYRFREQPRRSLIGAPCSTYGEHEQLWRGFLRLLEEPWVRDHRIQTSILYPAAGYIAMAVEGACQMAAVGQVIRDIRMKDVQIVAPAVVTEDSDMEFILQIRPHYSGTRDDSSAWQEFTVSTCNNGQDLRKNCYGLMLIEYHPLGETGVSIERRLEEQRGKELYKEAAKVCQTQEEPKAFYDDLSSLGLNYGPTFQNLSDIKSRNGQSCCDVVISYAGQSEFREGSIRPHVIHPSTLDAMFHAVFAAFKHKKGQLREAMVPKSIDEITISADTPFEFGTRFKGFAIASRHGFRELMGDIIMLDQDLSRPLVAVKNFHCTAISGTGESEEARQETNAGKLYSKQIWKPALEFCSAAQKSSLLDATSPALEESGLIAKSKNLALYFMRRALKQLPVHKIPTPHLRELHDWMQRECSPTVRGDSGHEHENEVKALRTQAEKDPQLLQTEVENGSIEGRALCKIGGSLQQIVLGKTDAGHLLRESGLLDRIFVELQGMSRCLGKITKLIDLMAHANPALSVLELGASTQTATSSIFSSLVGVEEIALPSFDYDFAAPHKATLDDAEKQLQTWKNRINFKHYDVSKCPSTQSFKDGSYDLVIVSDLQLAAQDPNTVLANLRKLLKPGGRLCIVQIESPRMELALVLGSLPSLGCAGGHGLHFGLMNQSTLKALLQKNDFEFEFTVADFEDSRDRELGVTIATANPATNNIYQKPLITVLEPLNPSDNVLALASRLETELASQGVKMKRATWSPNIVGQKISHCISLLELDRAFIISLVERDFAGLQKLILSSENMLWVNAIDDPAASLAIGMFRSIRNEVVGKRLRTLTLQSSSFETLDQLSFLIGRLATSFTTDEEFIEERGLLKTCRFVKDLRTNEEISFLLEDGKETMDVIPLKEAHGSQKLAIRTQGMLDTLCLESDDATTAAIGDDELDIEVKATGLNFRDVMVTMGQIPDNRLGFEASGIVSQCGKNVKRFSLGDKVSTLGHGSHTTIFRSKAAFCQPMPSGLSFEEAATLPLVHATAFHSLVNVARARPGQTVLIHAAAGGVGQSAIQLAKHLGLEIFATVGSGDKKQLIQEAYGIESDHIFNSRDLSFAKGVMRMTEGRGVDCILNSLSGEALRQSWQCIAAFGTFVEIGMKDILSNTGLEMRPFLQDASFTFFNLKHVMTDNPLLMAEILEGTFDYLRHRIIKPVSPINVYPISDVENAFRLLQTGKHRGKIALTWDRENVVPVLRRRHSPLKLDQDATYLLVGGLGGLGRSLALLLADSGAGHICFLSRSGGTSSTAQKLIRELEDRNVQTNCYSCDISDKDSLASALTTCSDKMPPIKGVFQCAMVLQDTLFERMSYAQWKASLSPKAAGTWNLHTLLPSSLSFFITLSSFAALFGNRTQSNYAAAGAYQDALSHYRRKLGLKAVTIDLGVMRDIGVIAEKGATDYLKEWELPFGMRENEFHILMKKVIASEMSTSGNTNTPTQIINGLATGATVHAAGIRMPFYFSDPRFSHLAAAGPSNGSASLSPAQGANPGATSLRDQLGAATTLTDAANTVTDALVARVAKSLQTEKSEIDEGRPLHSYGIDSLVGVEIANWVFRETKVGVSVFDILATVSIRDFSKGVAEKSAFFKEGGEEVNGN